MANKNVPMIRFAGFEDEWEISPLDRYVSRVTRKNTNLESDLTMTISAHYGLISQLEFFNKRIASTDLSGYYLMKKGEFTYNKSYSSEYPWGAVKRLDRYEQGVVSNLYIVFSHHDIDSDYLVSYYNTSKWHREVAIRAKEGARNHGLLNISAEDFFASQISVPKMGSEQFAIGSLINRLEGQIQQQRELCEKLRNLKSALLDKLFPKADSQCPSIRFIGFDNDWVTASLSKYAQRIKRKNKGLQSNLVMTISSQYGLIDQLEFFNKSVSGADLTNYYLLYNGEFAYNKSYSFGYPWGSVKRLDRYDCGVVSNLYIVFSLSDIDSEYITTYFMTDLWHRQLAMVAKEGARNHGLLNVSASDFLNIVITHPEDTREAQKIGAIIKSCDKLIALNDTKLSKLRNLKSAMLDKLFV